MLFSLGCIPTPQTGGSHFVSDRKLKPVELVWRDSRDNREELQNARIRREIELLEDSIEILQERIKDLKSKLVRFH